LAKVLHRRTEGNRLFVVAVFKGLPYDLPFGLELYETEYVSGVTAAQVPEARRKLLLDHKLRSEEDARDLVQQLERGTLQ
jgi:protein phosphatase